MDDAAKKTARAEVEQFQRQLGALREEIAKVIVGNREVVDGALTCMLAGSHALLEGVPGLGKTVLVKTLADALALTFSRIQFTPDLMPADIIGTTVIDEDAKGGKVFDFRKGPIFASIVLADEINRATPKTQSALLEAMQEHRVTVAKTTYPIEEPFFVLATQNPLEMEGTYPLPEAQLDRFFFKLYVPFPSHDELHMILERTTGTVESFAKPVLSRQDVLGMQRLVREVPVARPPSSPSASCDAGPLRAARRACFSPPRSARSSRAGSPPLPTTCARPATPRCATGSFSTSREKRKASRPTR
jgi:MoxR-like ATPase